MSDNLAAAGMLSRSAPASSASPPIPIEFANDDDGFFPDDEEEGGNDLRSSMSDSDGNDDGGNFNLAASAIFALDDDDDGEPIGWINGRPENEQQQQQEEEDVEMEDVHITVAAPVDLDDFIPAKAVTDDCLVMERTDPLSHYIADSPQQPRPQQTGSKGKRRNADEDVQRFHCYYCKAPIQAEPFYCPHPDSTVNRPIPDLEYPFCHPTCCKGWITWEVGEPLSARLCPFVDSRAGYVAPVAPAPFELLVNQMGGLKVREHFITGADARLAKNKDGKTGPQDLD